MNQYTREIISEYDSKQELYRRLADVAHDKLSRILADNGISRVHIAYRIKERSSVLDKLRRKAGKYHSIDDMTDVVGLRVICYFPDQVDQVSSIICDSFSIDADNSIDKRKILDPSTFGYLSMHYICRLTDLEGPESGIRFEIQIRTMLQHTWAEIEHDMGYKSEIAVPREVRRDFARVASLLEIADGYFMTIKNRLEAYENEVIESIRNERADDMALNRVTLAQFIRCSSEYTALNDDIASITGASLTESQSEHYLPLLQFFGLNTISDLKKLMSDEREHALSIARSILTDSEIEDLISTVGLYYLCRAKLIYGEYSVDEIGRFFAESGYDEDRIERLSGYILNMRERYKDQG